MAARSPKVTGDHAGCLRDQRDAVVTVSVPRLRK
jgi:hypothetical protein